MRLQSSALNSIYVHDLMKDVNRFSPLSKAIKRFLIIHWFNQYHLPTKRFLFIYFPHLFPYFLKRYCLLNATSRTRHRKVVADKKGAFFASLFLIIPWFTIVIFFPSLQIFKLPVLTILYDFSERTPRR